MITFEESSFNEVSSDRGGGMVVSLFAPRKKDSESKPLLGLNKRHGAQG